MNLKNSITYFIGTIIMGVLGLASSMILTRIIPAQVYAMYGLFTTFSTALIMIISFGYDSSYMRFYYSNGYTKKKFLNKCLKYPMIFLMIVSLILIEPKQNIVTIIFEKKFSYLCLLMIVIYLTFSIFQRFLQLTARMEGFAINYIVANIIAKSGFLLVIVIIYSIGIEITFTHIIFSFLISLIVATTVNYVVAMKDKKNEINSANQVTNKELLRYGFPFMINSVAVLLIPMVEKVVIRNLGGWEILSIYTAAAIFQTVITLLTNTIDNIWNPVVFKNCDNKKIFQPLLHNFGMLITFITAFGLSLCILLRRWLVMVLDSNYKAVYIIAPVIVYASCLSLIANIYSAGINISKKTIHFIVVPVIQIIISLCMNFILIPKFGLIGIGLSVLISISFSRMYKILVGLKLYNSGQSEMKSIIICILCILTSISSMLFTSLSNDIIMFLLINVMLLLVFNKDICIIYQEFKKLI